MPQGDGYLSSECRAHRDLHFVFQVEVGFEAYRYFLFWYHFSWLLQIRASTACTFTIDGRTGSSSRAGFRDRTVKLHRTKGKATLLCREG